MSTIANAKVEHNYNRYNGYFFGCLLIIIILKISQLVIDYNTRCKERV